MSEIDKLRPLSGAATEVMYCLFLLGPTEDGNVPSKSGRDDLYCAGLIDRDAVTRFHNIQIKRIMAGDRTLGDNRDEIDQAFARHRLAHSTPPASDVIERAVAAETERCARIAEKTKSVLGAAASDMRRNIAAAIRRSQPASDEGRT